MQRVAAARRADAAPPSSCGSPRLRPTRPAPGPLRSFRARSLPFAGTAAAPYPKTRLKALSTAADQFAHNQSE
eukprot:6949702-Alexandrium_andersonii.AAC.1